MLQLKKFPDIPVATREEARESRPHRQEPHFRLLDREEGSFPCVVGKVFPAVPSHLKWRRSPQERREELQGRATFPEYPRCLSPFQGNLFSLHCLEFQAEDRFTPRWHVGQLCGKASWESLDGKPRGKASWESLLGKPRGKASWESLVRKPRGKATDPLFHAKGSVTLLLQLGRKAHVHAPNRDED